MDEQQIVLGHDVARQTLARVGVSRSHFLSTLMSPATLVLVASVVVTSVFWTFLPDAFRVNEQSDYFGAYEPLARNLLAGHAFPIEEMGRMTAYPPGYAIVLAGVFKISAWLHISETAGLKIFAIICMALASLFIFLLSRMIWGSLPAFASSFVWITYPFALWLTKQPNSELPFMVVFFGGLLFFWATIKQRWSPAIYLLVGVVFGAAMLIRPIAVGISLVLSLILWLSRREFSRRLRALAIAALLAGNLIAVLPWESWVYMKTGNVIPLSTNGVKSMRDGLTFGVESKGYREGGHLPVQVIQVMHDLETQEVQSNSVGELLIVVWREFRTHPLGMTELLLLKLARSWFATDSERLELPILLVQLAYAGLIIFGVWKAFSSKGIHRQFAVGCLLMVAYFWFMSFATLSILRYMVPAMGILFMIIPAAYPTRLRPERSRRELSPLTSSR